MQHILIKFLTVGHVLMLSSTSFAQDNSLRQFETQLLHQYKAQNYFEVKGNIENEIRLVIKNNPSSFEYDFPKLQKNGYMQLDYSPDRKLKFYTFDVSGGGTMGEWSSYVQYQTPKQLRLDEFEAGRVNRIYQVKMGEKQIYLIESYYKADSCHGTYHLRAVEMGTDQLLKSHIFKSKAQKNHEIEVDFDCQYIDRVKQSKFFRITPKTVDVMLLNQDGIPQNTYLRYVLTQNGYRYLGVVK